MSELHYVDTHCHLMGEEFQEDLEEVIARCKEKHVDKLMIITLSLEETKKAIEFAKRNPENYKVAAGIFPEDVTKVDEKYWNAFFELAKDPMVTAIGEIGLEYHWVTDEADRAVRYLRYHEETSLEGIITLFSRFKRDGKRIYEVRILYRTWGRVNIQKRKTCCRCGRDYRLKLLTQ